MITMNEHDDDDDCWSLHKLLTHIVILFHLITIEFFSPPEGILRKLRK